MFYLFMTALLTGCIECSDTGWIAVTKEARIALDGATQFRVKTYKSKILPKTGMNIMKFSLISVGKSRDMLVNEITANMDLNMMTSSACPTALITSVSTPTAETTWRFKLEGGEFAVFRDTEMIVSLNTATQCPGLDGTVLKFLEFSEADTVSVNYQTQIDLCTSFPDSWTGVTQLTTDYEVGAEVTVVCGGIKYPESTVATCLAHNNWSGEPPECLEPGETNIWRGRGW